MPTNKRCQKAQAGAGKAKPLPDLLHQNKKKILRLHKEKLRLLLKLWQMRRPNGAKFRMAQSSFAGKESAQLQSSAALSEVIKHRSADTQRLKE